MHADGQPFSLGRIGQHKARTPLIALIKHVYDFGARPFKAYLADVESVSDCGKVIEQSFQDRTFWSVEWAVHAVHEAARQSEKNVFGHDVSL